AEAAARALFALPAGTPSLRLLADQAARTFAGLADALGGLALLVAAPDRAIPRRSAMPLQVPDWLPPLVNAGRAIAVIIAIQLAWIVTAWPSGAVAMTWTAITVILFAPHADEAYAGAVGFTAGNAVAAGCAAVLDFAVLPRLESFGAFAMALALYLVPAGVLLAGGLRPPLAAAMAGNFIPLLSPSNEMTYDTAAFYNNALAIFVGSSAAALSFPLLPPLAPAFRTRRLLGLSLRDLRRLARDPLRWTAADWHCRLDSRLAALPEQAEPVQRARLLATIGVGSEILRLRAAAAPLVPAAELDAALRAVAEGRSAAAAARLVQLDRRLASEPEAEGGGGGRALRVRASMLAIVEGLTEHAVHFDAEAAV
ncbi:MAG TPA: FUSC family protein, partial [Crenalkalicoccus sp.]|nr:FUSC family protein [Crenalkalicoccus sp.]